MAIIKVKRHTPVVDMTAMCDVCFLLLNFFIMTSQFKTPEALPVDIPASTVQIKVPDNGIATLSVATDKVFFQYTGTGCPSKAVRTNVRTVWSRFYRS